MANYLVNPLDGGFERIRRADEHLQSLDREIRNVIEQQAHGVQFNLSPKPPHRIENVKLPSETFFGMRIGILIGEICYNLRSALDYLTYELAKLDSGTEQQGTQFPIFDAKADFEKRSKSSYLKGVNQSHAAQIEKLQPYNGCNWTKQLRDFSNPDKHRHLVATGGTPNFTVHSSLEKDLSKIGEPAFARKTRHPLTGCEVDIKVHVHCKFKFEDGSPALETLQEIKCNISSTLEAFKSDLTRNEI